MKGLVCFAFVIFSSLILNIAKSNGGFTIELIHRYSPLSPLYNKSITPAECLRNAARRSVARLDYFRVLSLDEKSIESVVTPNGGSYNMQFSIGTPPVQIVASADTGSDLIWIQCLPCVHCYKQDAEPFNPSTSSTYQTLPCASKPCTTLPATRRACGSTNQCLYSYSYGDQSFTKGDLSTDTITFGTSSNDEPVSFPTSVFGCGHSNDGTFNSRTAGLVGLGGGPLSLISQLGDKIDHKFSYCLLPYFSNSASKLRFGMEAIISSQNGVVSTPLVPKTPSTFYYLTLQGISIADKTVPSDQGEGNIIIDSGTTLTLLETSLYNNLEQVITEAIGLEPVQDPQGSFKLCFAEESVSDDGFPDMIFHFTGADLRLKPLNTFIKHDNLVCLSIIPSDSLSIFGNMAQVNFQIEYDLQGKKVSFAPADCTN